MAKRKSYRLVLYLLCRMVAAVIYVLPFSVAKGIVVMLSKGAYYVVKRQRVKTLENVRFAYTGVKSEKEIQKFAQKVFENVAIAAVEILHFPKWTFESLSKNVDTEEAFRIYDQLLQEGKGLISMTAHIGNWELLAGAASCLKGYQGAVVARRIYYELYDQWIVGLRRSLKIRTLYRGESIREILSLLKRNEIIGILPDQDIDSVRGIFVNYFGRPAWTAVAPAKISLMSGAPILTNFMIRKPQGQYKLLIGEIIRPRYDVDRRVAIQEMTEKWMGSFEETIRVYPEQWVWMHSRWKTQPKPSGKFTGDGKPHFIAQSVSN